MERQEPSIGKLVDLRDVQFGRTTEVRHPRSVQAKAPMDLTWKIAAGVFLGLSLFALATCTSLVMLGAAVQQEEERVMRDAVEQINAIARDPDPLGWQQQARDRERRQADALRLRPGERCIQGKRFQRVENGWVQLSQPCQP